MPEQCSRHGAHLSVVDVQVEQQRGDACGGRREGGGHSGVGRGQVAAAADLRVREPQIALKESIARQSTQSILCLNSVSRVAASADLRKQ